MISFKLYLCLWRKNKKFFMRYSAVALKGFLRLSSHGNTVKQQIFCILCHLAFFGIIFLSERLFIQSRIIIDFEFIKIKTEVLL